MIRDLFSDINRISTSVDTYIAMRQAGNGVRLRALMVAPEAELIRLESFYLEQIDIQALIDFALDPSERIRLHDQRVHDATLFTSI